MFAPRRRRAKPAQDLNHQVAKPTAGRRAADTIAVRPRPIATENSYLRLPSQQAARSSWLHPQRAADEALCALARPALDDLDKALEPLDLDRVRNLVAQGGRLGAPPGREDEGERAVVTDLLGHRDGLLEVGLCLARKADDDVGGEGAVRDVLADHGDPIEVTLARVGPPHPLEDRGRAGLEREVDVLA